MLFVVCCLLVAEGGNRALDARPVAGGFFHFRNDLRMIWVSVLETFWHTFIDRKPNVVWMLF